MSYTIPNYADATVPAQAAPDKVDFDIITAASGLTGVISGCAASVTGSDMNVTVAAGVVVVAGKEAAVASGALALTSDGSQPKWYLITVDNAGTKYATAGSANANPVFPAIPAGRVVLHAVYLTAGDTQIASNQIVDKRVTVLRDDSFLVYAFF